MADHILQLVDVTAWRADDFFATYPEGARDKRAFFPPDDCSLHFIKPLRRYLFKRSDSRYPEQFWCEIVAYELGRMIGVTVPPAYPAIDSSKNEAAALIEWFYEDGQQLSVLGGLFMQRMIPGFDMKTGTQHNFKSIRTLFRRLPVSKEWLGTWARGLIFDALIGNTDRHQNNWAILFDPTMEPLGHAELAPWFDNGTSLGCERWEKNASNWTQNQLDRYLYNGKHHLRWEKTSEKRVGFFEMPRLLMELDVSLCDPMLDCVRAVDLPRLRAFLDDCQSVPSTIPLSAWRADFMCRLIERRQAILVEILS